MTYEAWSSFAQTWGLAYFVAVFAVADGVCGADDHRLRRLPEDVTQPRDRDPVRLDQVGERKVRGRAP